MAPCGKGQGAPQRMKPSGCVLIHREAVTEDIFVDLVVNLCIVDLCHDHVKLIMMGMVRKGTIARKAPRNMFAIDTNELTFRGALLDVEPFRQP